MIYPFKDKTPVIDPSVFIADYTTITGDVTIGPESTIWFNTVIRGDVSPTIIGRKVNIQDLCCLHQSPQFPLILEDEVTIGHQVTLHSCTVKKGALDRHGFHHFRRGRNWRRCIHRGRQSSSTWQENSSEFTGIWFTCQSCARTKRRGSQRYGTHCTRVCGKRAVL